MFILVLKFILALILTAIPFVFHYCFKPKSKTDPKWKSLFSFLRYSSPFLMRKKRMIKYCYLRIIHRMQFSENARKLFTYILILVLICIQVVDYQSSRTASEKLDVKEMTVSLSHLVVQAKSQGNMDIASLVWYANTTPFEILVTCLVITLLLFSFTVSDIILTMIHNGKWLQWVLLAFLAVVLFIDYGRLFLLAETIYVILLAGMFYPNRNIFMYFKWRNRIRNKSHFPGIRFLRRNQGRKAA